MSATILKDFSARRVSGGYRVSYHAACTNVSPRIYDRVTTFVPDAEYDDWITRLAECLFGDEVRFLPSSHCLAHQAYQLAYAKAGDWSRAEREHGYGTEGYRMCRDAFVTAFKGALAQGRDHGRYVVTVCGTPVWMKAGGTDGRAHVVSYRINYWAVPNAMPLESALLLCNTFARDDMLVGAIGYAPAAE